MFSGALIWCELSPGSTILALLITAMFWERFHELLRRCPHHRLTRWMQVHTFYNGLSDSTRIIIDASVGGLSDEEDYRPSIWNPRGYGY